MCHSKYTFLRFFTVVCVLRDGVWSSSFRSTACLDDWMWMGVTY